MEVGAAETTWKEIVACPFSLIIMNEFPGFGKRTKAKKASGDSRASLDRASGAIHYSKNAIQSPLRQFAGHDVFIRYIMVMPDAKTDRRLETKSGIIGGSPTSNTTVWPISLAILKLLFISSVPIPLFEKQLSQIIYFTKIILIFRPDFQFPISTFACSTDFLAVPKNQRRGRDSNPR